MKLYIKDWLPSAIISLILLSPLVLIFVALNKNVDKIRNAPEIIVNNKFCIEQCIDDHMNKYYKHIYGISDNFTNNFKDICYYNSENKICIKQKSIGRHHFIFQEKEVHK